jgi:hypothetical protein
MACAGHRKEAFVLRFAAYAALAACLIAPAPVVAADTCETRPLPYDADQTGELDASDCSTTSLRNSTSEIWTFDAVIGDRIVVMMNRKTMSDPDLLIVDAAGFWVAVGDDVAGDRDARAEFNVLKTGTYRAIATSFAREPLTDYGTYTIRLSRMITPAAPILWSVTALGNQVTLTWSAALSSSPLIGYTLEVGATSGATDIGVFWVGPTTQVVASAGPGMYFVRVRGPQRLGSWCAFSRKNGPGLRRGAVGATHLRGGSTWQTRHAFLVSARLRCGGRL